MPRRADSTLLARLEAVRVELADLEGDLRRFGDPDLADVAKRAHREFAHPNYTGAINTLGVNFHAVRR